MLALPEERRKRIKTILAVDDSHGARIARRVRGCSDSLLPEKLKPEREEAQQR